MRAMNNTWGHYQDNRVEWFFDDPGRAHLQEYVNAGVIGLWFGMGAGGVTCPCDQAGDGVTNPAPINGNTGNSLSADDDGGFFEQKVQQYYAAGAMSLTGGGAVPTPTRTPTTVPPSNTPVPSATPIPGTPVSSATPAPSGSWNVTANVSAASVQAGQSEVVTANVVAPAGVTSGLVDIEIYAPNGQRVHQFYRNNVSFGGGVAQVQTTWTPTAGSQLGSYTVMIGVFPNNWGQVLHWNSNAAQFTVTAPQVTTWQATATVSAATVGNGANERVTVRVTPPSAATTAVVDIEIYDPNGNRVHQRYFENVQFTGSQRQFVTDWRPSASNPRGIYTVKIGVFGAGWQGLHHWNNQAVQFRVR
jgi:hypothetical protein